LLINEKKKQFSTKEDGIPPPPHTHKEEIYQSLQIGDKLLKLTFATSRLANNYFVNRNKSCSKTATGVVAREQSKSLVQGFQTMFH